MYAVIRIRGSVNVRQDIKDTMRLLRLTRPNHCVLVAETDQMRGMLRKAQNFVTWGEIDPSLVPPLVHKRGRLPGNQRLDEQQSAEISGRLVQGVPVGIKAVFRLSPPSKGHKSVKQMYPRGASGYRGAAINALLKKMI